MVRHSRHAFVGTAFKIVLIIRFNFIFFLQFLNVISSFLKKIKYGPLLSEGAVSRLLPGVGLARARPRAADEESSSEGGRRKRRGHGGGLEHVDEDEGPRFKERSRVTRGRGRGGCTPRAASAR
jgi:hypothetical protein